MTTTFRQPGNTVTLTAPSGGVVAGRLYIIAGLAAIACAAADEGDEFEADVVGIHALTKVGSQAWAEGQRVYWDRANSRCSTDPTVGLEVGVAAAVVADGASDTTGEVRLNGISATRGVMCVRKRFSIAEVNAVGGTTIVPAVPGAKIRMIDVAAIAVGGAVATATTVDIVGTLSASTRKLVAYAVAALTQSALVRAGAANATLLADGASFTPNDAGAAVVISKTGSDAATATHVDVIFTFALDN